MKAFLSCLLAAGLLTVPAVASAEPQYVYVQYGRGEPYLFVTTKPLPYYTVDYQPRPIPYYPDVTYVERSDGLRFDSEVGALCSALNTDIQFGPHRTALDSSDRSTLGHLGYCFTRGALAGERITVVASYDGSLASSQLAMARLNEVIGQLQMAGVPTNQLTYSKRLTPGWQSDRISFRLSVPRPWPRVLR